MKKKNKTLRIAIRLTEEDYANIKDKSTPFGTMSNYIRQTLRDSNTVAPIEYVTMLRSLSEVYKRYDSILYHTTSNLNQIVKRANELIKSDQLNETYFKMYMMPDINRTLDLMAAIRSTLIDIMNNKDMKQ